MKFLRSSRLSFILGLAASTGMVWGQTPSPTAAAPRNWTTADGKAFQASLVKIEGSVLWLKFPNGQMASFPVGRLSPADQLFIKNSLLPSAAALASPTAAAAVAPAVSTAKQAAPGAAAAAAHLPPDKRTWPAKVEVDSRAIEVKPVTESSTDGKYVYRSQSFEFTSEDKLAGSVLKEIARTFEATHSLIEALPWEIDPRPPADLGLYQAKFYLSRASYIAAGGPENSGGVYSSRDRTFKVPFPSLGLEIRGKTWFKDENYRNDTIVHEITHQMMHDYLPFLPVWITEGTAEYTEMIPYNAGKFLTGSHERGIKEYLKEAATHGLSPANIGSVMDHLTITGEKWHSLSDSGGSDQHRLYFASCVLVYYFCHLDGDGKGTRFFQYLDKIREARDAWDTFFKDPRVKHEPNGRYSFPSDLPQPTQKRGEAYGLENISILLDGRDKEQMQKAVIDGYKKIGVRW